MLGPHHATRVSDLSLHWEKHRIFSDRTEGKKIIQKHNSGYLLSQAKPVPSEGLGKEWPEGPCHCSSQRSPSHLVNSLQALFTQRNHFPKLPKIDGRPGKVALKTVPRNMRKLFYPRWEAAFLPHDRAASHA